jgi:hypothetical protein
VRTRSHKLSSINRPGSGSGSGAHGGASITVGARPKSKIAVAMSTPEMPSVSV